MEKRKKLLSAILSVSMIASAFTALPLSASAEGEQNSGEEVTATVSPSTTTGVESTDKPVTTANPEATGVVYEDQKIKITNAKADKLTIVISKYYDNKTLAGVELKDKDTFICNNKC